MTGHKTQNFQVPSRFTKIHGTNFWSTLHCSQRLSQDTIDRAAVKITAQTSASCVWLKAGTGLWQLLSIAMTNWLILTEGMHAFKRLIFVKVALCIESNYAWLHSSLHVLFVYGYNNSLHSEVNNTQSQIFLEYKPLPVKADKVNCTAIKASIPWIKMFLVIALSQSCSWAH